MQISCQDNLSKTPDQGIKSDNGPEFVANEVQRKRGTAHWEACCASSKETDSNSQSSGGCSAWEPLIAHLPEISKLPGTHHLYFDAAGRITSSCEPAAFSPRWAFFNRLLVSGPAAEDRVENRLQGCGGALEQVFQHHPLPSLDCVSVGQLEHPTARRQVPARSGRAGTTGSEPARGERRALSHELRCARPSVIT